MVGWLGAGVVEFFSFYFFFLGGGGGEGVLD